jgi:hypothetical protein
MNSFVAIRGACHCRNIRFTLRWPKSETEVPIRECSCTFCKKHAAAWTSHRLSELELKVHDKTLVSKYGFGTGTADFFTCSKCGVVLAAVSEIDGDQYAVVNANTFDDIEGISYTRISTDFDGEETGSRLERRKKNWIPTVTITSSSD